MALNEVGEAVVIDESQNKRFLAYQDAEEALRRDFYYPLNSRSPPLVPESPPFPLLRANRRLSAEQKMRARRK